MTDNVNHPSHYTSDPSGVECIQITRHRNFAIGSAIKYLWRAGLKDSAPATEDLEKAIWYIRDEIERLNEEAGKNRLRELMQRDVTGDHVISCKTCRWDNQGISGRCLSCDNFGSWEPKP